MNPNFLQSIIDEKLAEHNKAVLSVKSQLNVLSKLCTQLETCLKNNGKVLWFGNGGSASDAQHLSAELMVKFRKKRLPFASIALTTDTSILTAHANDFEYETVFARQVEALAQPQDIVIGISTSGNSENVYLGIAKAKELRCYTFSLLGNGGGMINQISTDSLIVDSSQTAQIQEAHIFAGHLICEHLDVMN